MNTLLKNEIFTSRMSWEIPAGDRLTLENCTFVGAGKAVVTGAGDFVTKNLVSTGSVINVLSINVLGKIELTDTTLVAGVQSPLHRWSAVTVRNTFGGTIERYHADGFTGNSILIEVHPAQGQVVKDLKIIDATSVNAGGGMWLMNATNCVINFTGINSNYHPQTGCPEGHVFDCILDEQFDPATGERGVGNTLFSDITCSLFGPNTSSKTLTSFSKEK